MTMTMKVYRVGADGVRQDISTEETDGVPLPVVDPGYPPCACPFPACQRALKPPAWLAERRAS